MILEAGLSSLINARCALLKVIVSPVALPLIKNPCPTGMNLPGTLELEPAPLIPAGATGGIPPTRLYVA
jgi:hypothetical protein